MPASYGIFILRFVSEGEVAFGVEILGVDKSRPALAHTLGVEARTVGVKRGDSAENGERICCRTACFEIYGSSRGVLRGRLACLELIGIEQRYRLKCRQRVFAEVDSTILRIGQPHTVDIDSHMLRTERTHIDCLHASETAEVFNLHTGKILECVGNRSCRHGLQLFSGDCLHCCNRTACGCHFHIPKHIYCVSFFFRLRTSRGGDCERQEQSRKKPQPAGSFP